MFKVMEVEAMSVKCRNGSCYEVPRGAKRALYSLYDEHIIDDIEKEMSRRTPMVKHQKYARERIIYILLHHDDIYI